MNQKHIFVSQANPAQCETAAFASSVMKENYPKVVYFDWYVCFGVGGAFGVLVGVGSTVDDSYDARSSFYKTDHTQPPQRQGPVPALQRKRDVLSENDDWLFVCVCVCSVE